jgi:chromosome segregation ATPase
MFNLGLKAYVGIAIVVAVTAAVALSYRHYSGLVESNAQLTGQVATLKEDVSREKARADALEKSIDRWDSAAKAQAKALEDLTTAKREAGAYSRELKDVLSKHDLGALAKRKPGLIERRINDGSDRALRLLEQSTQATAADGGQAATAAGAARP